MFIEKLLRVWEVNLTQLSHALFCECDLKKERNDERCLQEEKKSKSVKALNEECKDEHGDKKKGSIFPWPRNRSFGKGNKKKDLGEYSEFKLMDFVFTWCEFD